MARTVLLVEDDAAIATVIEAAMADEGFDVVRCPSVAERDRLLALINLEIWARIYLDRREPADVAVELKAVLA